MLDLLSSCLLDDTAPAVSPFSYITSPLISQSPHLINVFIISPIIHLVPISSQLPLLSLLVNTAKLLLVYTPCLQSSSLISLLNPAVHRSTKTIPTMTFIDSNPASPSFLERPFTWLTAHITLGAFPASLSLLSLLCRLISKYWSSSRLGFYSSCSTFLPQVTSSSLKALNSKCVLMPPNSVSPACLPPLQTHIFDY